MGPDVTTTQGLWVDGEDKGISCTRQRARLSSKSCTYFPVEARRSSAMVFAHDPTVVKLGCVCSLTSNYSGDLVTNETRRRGGPSRLQARHVGRQAKQGGVGGWQGCGVSTGLRGGVSYLRQGSWQRRHRHRRG